MDKCCLCEKPATILDTEYDEYYCNEHAWEYKVKDGPYRILEDKDDISD